MFTTHTSKTVLGCLMLVAVLVVTAPALAMNDPATGRWIKRDPLIHNRMILLPIEPLNRKELALGDYVGRPEIEVVERIGVEKYYNGTRSLYLLQHSNPILNSDPSGLCPPDPACSPYPAAAGTSACGFYLPWHPVEYAACVAAGNGAWANCVRCCLQRCYCLHPWCIRWGAIVFTICHADCFSSCPGTTPTW